MAEVVAYSPPLEALLQPPYSSALWTSPWKGLGLGAEGEIYPGVLVVGLIALGWTRGRRASGERHPAGPGPSWPGWRLGGRTARFLRLRQVAEGAAVPWIVAELVVLGAPE